MGLTAHQLVAIEKILHESSAAVLVTVIDVKGSAPRGAGTPMIVLQNAIVGTIGGGRLEFEAMATAHEMIKQKDKTPLVERYPLGDRLGQCCGGSVELMFEPVEPGWKTWITEAMRALQQRAEYVRSTDVGYAHVVKSPQAHLVLCGAGHVGRALVQVLSNAPISVHWVDERAAEFPQNVPSNVVCEVTDLPQSVVEKAPTNCAVLITTHRHDLDFSLAEIAISRTDLAYCGMIGSMSKRGRFERQWRRRGRDSESLSRLVCPIGSAGPRGKEPEMVALAVAAEMLRLVQGVNSTAVHR